MKMSPATSRRLLKIMLLCSFLVVIVSNAMSGRFAIALSFAGLGLFVFGLHGLPEGAAVRGKVLLASLVVELAACALLVASFAA